MSRCVSNIWETDVNIRNDEKLKKKTETNVEIRFRLLRNRCRHPFR